MNLKLNMVPNAETIDKQRELFELNPAANDAPGEDGRTPVDPLTTFGKRTIPLGKSRLIKDPFAMEDALLEERQKGERSFGGLFFSLLVVAVVAMHLLFAWILEKRQQASEPIKLPPLSTGTEKDAVSSSSTAPIAAPPVKPRTPIPETAPPLRMAPLPKPAAPPAPRTEAPVKAPLPAPKNVEPKPAPPPAAVPPTAPEVREILKTTEVPSAAPVQQQAPAVETDKLLNILNKR